MKTGLQLGSLLLQVGSQMMNLTWSNKDLSKKAVSIFETVIVYPLKTTAINNLIRKYSFMRSYLNTIPFIFYAFLILTSRYSILNL